MDRYSFKLKLNQGIALLFLLLVIPVGIYIFQTQNIGEIRSQAGAITPELCESFNNPNATGQSALFGRLYSKKCPEGQKYTFDVGYSSEKNMYGKPKKYEVCLCKPIVGAGGGLSTSITSIPTGTITQRCNTACADDASCGEGMVCVQVEGSGKCRNAQCYGVEDCWCFKTTSPSPGPACNAACTTDVDCGQSFICVKTATGNKCRNPQCFGMEDCLCYSTLTTPTPPSGVGGSEQNFSDEQEAPPPPRIITRPPVYATPTPISDSSSMLLAELLAVSPTPNPLLVQPKTAAPILTIYPFYNAKKQTNPTFTLSGTSDPDAELNLSIFPDGVAASVIADSLGYWQYALPKSLTNGEKQLTVVARSQNGGQMTKTETFTIVGGFQFPFAAVVFGILILGGVGGYLYYLNRKAKNSAVPPSPPQLPQL